MDKLPVAASSTSLLTLLLPKCPFCWMGILGALGIHSSWAGSVTAPLALCCIAPGTAVLYSRSRRTHNWGPLWLYLLAAGILLTGEFVWESAWSLAAAVPAMVGATVWSTERNTGCACE